MMGDVGPIPYAERCGSPKGTRDIDGEKGPANRHHAGC
jgi:hypothetical protein